MSLDTLMPENIAELTEEEITQLAQSELDGLPGGIEEKREQIDLLKNKVLIQKAQSEFSIEGFRAYFEFMHGSPLHKEGEKWVRNIFTAIESGTRKMLQEAFRGSGKTTVFSKYFLSYFVGHHPHTTNVVIRINDNKSNETVSEVAAIIERDPKWGEVFTHVVPDKERGWGENKGYFVKRDDITYGEWMSLCAEKNRPTGSTFIGYGYNSGSVIGTRVTGVMIIDDIHDKDNTKSDRQLADVKEFVTETLLPIPVPDEAVEIWNFTPWLSNDAYSERKATGLYTHSRSPVMWPAEEGEGEYWPEEFGIPLLDEKVFPYAKQWWHLAWPERWGIEQIAYKYIDVGHIAFVRMYMLDLEAMKGQRLKADWLHKFTAEKIDPSWPTFFGIDYASVADRIKHKDRDYFALAIYRAIPGGGLVLTDGYRGHLSKGEALQKTASYAAMYPTLLLIGVESIGKGEEFFNDLVLINDVYGNPLPLIEIKHGRRSKGDRFEEWLAPRFQMARIWVSDVETPFIRNFYDEWLTYPAGEHDDCLDGAYMGALAGEGHMPSKAARSGKKEKEECPFNYLGRS